MAKSTPKLLNRHILDRLMHYYRCLHELDPTSNDSISSAHLAGLLSLDDSQIRKDLAAIGLKGHCHVGFQTSEVIASIGKTLGITDPHTAVVIGAGRLGGALCSYQGFEHYGLHVSALFDVDTNKIGLVVGGHIVQPIQQLEAIIAHYHACMGILTVPAAASQESADRLVKAGVKVIWNFAPSQLQLPDNVFVRHEHLFVALGQLFYNLQRM